MKKILLSAAFVVLSLSACGDGTEQECKKKGSSWFWDKEEKKCKEKTGDTSETGETTPMEETRTVDTPESCKSKPGGYVWDVENSQCKEIDYFMVIQPQSYQETVYVLYSEAKANNFNDYNPQILVSKEGCVKVAKSVMPYMIVMVWRIGAAYPLCNNTDFKCQAGVYEIGADERFSDRAELKKIIPTEERKDCVALEPPR